MLPVILGVLGGGAALLMFALLIARMCGMKDRVYEEMDGKP